MRNRPPKSARNFQTLFFAPIRPRMLTFSPKSCPIAGRSFRSGTAVWLGADETHGALRADRKGTMKAFIAACRNWIQEHPFAPLELVRIYVGVGLLIKGLFFLRN